MKKNTLNLIGKGIALSLLTSTLLHATNGDNLISVGAKARGMGGTGIALSHGAESTLTNPALITTVEGTEISFGGTIFMPDVKSQLPFPGNAEHTSDADINLIPEVSIAHKINNNWSIGVGMWGTAGMGTDYSKATFNPGGGQMGNFQMVTNLQLMQFAVPVAYKTGGLSIAVAPIVQYGNLDISYFNPGSGATNGAGLAQDFGFGFSTGLSYDFSQNGISGLTLGAVYKSAIEMKYDGQLTTATAPFGLTLPDGDTLEQPAEYGIGLAYTTGQHTFGVDYKKIKWSSAKGYKDFGWDDQSVYSIGYEYAQDNWKLRAGYNHAKSAVVEVADPRLNFFNLLGFPATGETHYTVGGSYEFSKTFSMDLAYVRQADSKKSYSIAGIPGFPPGTINTSHAEDSVSIQLNYKF